MTSMTTRFVCAMMSTMGAAGLVVFADPANAVGSAKPAAHAATVAVATPTTLARRG